MLAPRHSVSGSWLRVSFCQTERTLIEPASIEPRCLPQMICGYIIDKKGAIELGMFGF
jgi:hypothetical protein